MQKKESVELKVGIFVLMALAALGILVFKAGDFYLKPGYHLRLVFDYVSGVEKSSPVHLAGVQVGEITNVNVVRDAEGMTRVELTARIDQGIYIEEDAEARISTLGLLGEKYVEIRPGTTGAKTLPDGSTLVGKPPLALEEITKSGNRLIGKLEDTVENINKVVKDPEFQASVKNTFAKTDKTFTNAEVVTKNLLETTDDLKDAAKSARVVLGRLRDGEGTIGRLLKDDTIAKDTEAFVKDIKAHPWKLLKKD
jgi:phospholipid/cholesterol/gamma-HCH transport system substrate-binding protein